MMRKHIGIIFLIGVVLAAAFGSAGRKVPKVDVAAGEYHGEDDLAKMSRRAKNNYCSDLENELVRTQTEFDGKAAHLQEMKDLIESIRKQIIPLERDVIRLDADIRTMNDQIREVRVHGSWSSDNGSALVTAACAGIGLVRITDYYVALEIERGELEAVLEDYEVDDAATWILFPNRLHLPTRVRLLIEFLVDSLRRRN